jgi:hypothetical protein
MLKIPVYGLKSSLKNELSYANSLYLHFNNILEMITRGKTAVLVLLMGFGFFVFTGFSNPEQEIIIPCIHAFMPACVKDLSGQEPVKYRYVGMEKCASVCHNTEEMGFQYDIVKNSQHANAYRILSSEKAFHFAKNANIKENPMESQVCLKCHVTGGGLDSSFFAATYKKEDGVTCEACHKGAFITKTYIPKEADCLICHNDSVHNIRQFNFSNACAKIAHPRPKTKLQNTKSKLILSLYQYEQLF